MNNQALNTPPDKLSMLDAKGHKLRIYAAEVSGVFRKHRSWVHAVLMILFLILPWIKIRGYQSVLLDIPGRRFAMFGLTFWAHDVPLVVFILGIGVFSLMLATVLWGRVWCGWACPQTVFIDAVFLRLERWIEGNHLQRRQLDAAKMSFGKIFKKSLKWLVFVLAGAIIAHSFLAYFVGTERLMGMMSSDPRQNPTPFLFVFAIAAVLIFNFGWFREQFCIILCPYGRIQSAMQDRRTINISYDADRGEPRRGSVQDGKSGDCVNCFKCVQVCPTGIDIRNGIQLECIGCTACIDACNDIMKKVGKPGNLIRYASLSRLPMNFLRARVLVPVLFIFLCVGALAFNVHQRQLIKVFVLRGKETPFTVSQVAGRDYVTNHFRLHLQNQSFDTVQVEIGGSADWLQKEFVFITPEKSVALNAGEFKMIHFFVQMPVTAFQGMEQISSKIVLKYSQQQDEEEIQLVGPSSN